MIPIQHDESYADTPWQVIDPAGEVVAAYSEPGAAAAARDRLPAGHTVQHFRAITLAKIRAAVAAQIAEDRAEGYPRSTASHAMNAFLDQLEGLDLSPQEWRTVAWFIGWDANDNMASVLRKARAAGVAPAVEPQQALTGVPTVR